MRRGKEQECRNPGYKLLSVVCIRGQREELLAVVLIVLVALVLVVLITLVLVTLILVVLIAFILVAVVLVVLTIILHEDTSFRLVEYRH